MIIANSHPQSFTEKTSCERKEKQSNLLENSILTWNTHQKLICFPRRACIKEIGHKLLVKLARWISYQTHTSLQTAEWERNIIFSLEDTHWINTGALSSTTCSNKKHAMIIYSHMLVTFNEYHKETVKKPKKRKKKHLWKIKFILLYAYIVQ